jgi:hypothetical protein
MASTDTYCESSRQNGIVSVSPGLRWPDDKTDLVPSELDGQGFDLSRILELDDTPYSIARACHEPAVRGYVQKKAFFRREARQGSADILGFE